MDNLYGESIWIIYMDNLHGESMDMVGGFTPSENMKVNWDDDIINKWENKSYVPVTTNQLGFALVDRFPI